MIWGPNALKNAVQGVPHKNAIGRKWALDQLEKIPREFIAFCIMVVRPNRNLWYYCHADHQFKVRFLVSPDPEFTDASSKTGFNYVQSWSDIVELLYETSG